MKRRITAVVFSLAFWASLVWPVPSVAAGGGVPQAVLDLRPSVVRVLCETPDSMGTGTGFAIGKDNVQYIVTNLHVVQDNPAGVSILRAGNSRIAASVCLQLPNADLCVLKLNVPLDDMTPVTLCDHLPAQTGEAIYTLGFPSAADVFSDKITGNPEDITITDGIVSAVKSLTLQEGSAPISMVQIDAAISPGNSGGPLVNEKGQVLGVNSYKSAADNSENINGAVSILELIDRLDSEGIPYLSAADTQETKSGTFPLPWILAGTLLVAVAFVLVLIFRSRKKGVAIRGANLEEYLRQWGGRLPYDMAIRVLEPVLRELAALHASGRCHGDVCPENILFSGNRASLLPAEGGHGGKVVLRQGYSASEQYRADGRIGPWSDVYAVCAMLFYTVTGTQPLGILERQQMGGDTLSFGGAAIEADQAQVILAGMALDAAARPQNCVELVSQLGLPAAVAQTELTGSIPSQTYSRTRTKRKSRGKKALVVAVAVVILVLGAGATAYYFICDKAYQDAIACISLQDYTGGANRLSHVPSFFKDREKWLGFAIAGMDIQNHQFDEASKVFKNLGDFNEASTMVREVRYQEALFALSRKEFSRAAEMFAAMADYKDSKKMILEVCYQVAMEELQNKDYASAIHDFAQLGDYKDSEDMIKECNYQKAIDVFNSNDVLQAIPMFQSLPGYKDSDQFVARSFQSIYELAVAYYRDGDYDMARYQFTTISSFERCKDYMTLIETHDIFKGGMKYSQPYLQQAYKAILALGDFEDAAVLAQQLKKLLK